MIWVARFWRLWPAFVVAIQCNPAKSLIINIYSDRLFLLSKIHLIMPSLSFLIDTRTKLPRKIVDVIERIMALELLISR